MSRTVLVTGGFGFVGRAVVAAIQESHPDWLLSNLDVAEPDNLKKNTTHHHCDVTDVASVNEVVSRIRPTAIIHTAGIVPALVDRYGRTARENVFKVNVEGTRNILAAAKANGIEAFVWTGSCTAVTDDFSKQYPNIDESWPVSSHSLIYGESKTAAEALVLAANDGAMAACALRPSVIFGPGDPQMVPSLHTCIAKGETPFVIGDGLNMWDLTYVGNVADAHVLALENLLSSKTAAGRAIFISNEEPVPFRDFCLAVWKEFGHFPPYQVKIPEALAAFAGIIAEYATWVTGAASTLSRGSVRDACQVRYCSGIAARSILRYKPQVSLEEGIRISCEEYKQRLKRQARRK